jgi:SAM-dependent methyltransferase
MQERLIDNFLKIMKGEWEDGFEVRYRPLLAALIKFMNENPSPSYDNLQKFLHSKNIFVCETFLRYIQTQNDLKPISKKNIKRLISSICSYEITGRAYDERIEALGVDHAIRNYWEPEEPVGRRRVETVFKAVTAQHGKVIIDVGCGVGTFAYRAALRGAYTIGVDYSLKSVMVAKSLAERKFFGSGKIHFIAADATRLPFKDSSADVIVAADFIEHINNIGKERFLDEAVRVLSKNGRMIIFTPNKLREFIGTIVRWFRGGEGTRLHFGLTTRFAFEKKLKKRGFEYKRLFVDVGRPFLATIPVVREFLALEILWIVKK